MTESTRQHVYTANNKDGHSTYHDFSTKPVVHSTPFGSVENIYALSSLLPNVSANSTSDLEATTQYHQAPFANGRLVPDAGLSAAIVTMNPGVTSPNHRTRTLDIAVIIEGEMDLYLDNGEVRTLKQGDTFVQRGTIHQWVNKSDKPCRVFGVAVDAQKIEDGNGNELKEEWLF